MSLNAGRLSHEPCRTAQRGRIQVDIVMNYVDDDVLDGHCVI